MILIPFIIWMLFFDENSYVTHKKFDKEIEELESTISFYKNKIDQDKETIKKLQDSLELERFAREKYLMKKENEDIYIIEFDTIKK
jgi:cell division protein DivIC